MVACFLTLPGLRVSAENPSGVNAEVNAPQNIDIKGRIVDQNGQPVIGASLFQQGTNNGTVADVDGRFSINVPNGASLKVSCLGYQDVIVTARNGMTIMMKEDNEVLSEVVVVGYGAQKRADITGAVASVDVGKTLESRPIADVGRGLQGAVPGMNIVVPTGEVGSDPLIKTVARSDRSTEAALR